MENKSKSEHIYELLPHLLNAKSDQNWSSLVDAIGEEDGRLAQLIEEVRKQFFVKTASGSYLDSLAANSNITRPRLVGMGDTTFRSYIPVISYQPKQVKNIVDSLLDIFFLKEATTAFIISNLSEPFVLQSGWDISLTIDNDFEERIVFESDDFSSISAATAQEVAVAYNRQAQYSYAVTFFDSVTNHTYVRIFTKSTGAQGSIRVTGGLANIGFHFSGFISGAGNGTNTQWQITKVGDKVKFTYTGGALPGLDQLEVGDVAISQIEGNSGSFTIVDIASTGDSFSIVNLFGTPAMVTQTSSDQLKFLRPDKYTPYLNDRRALTWETGTNAITVEMPATPAVLERNLKGGFHINGTTALVTSFDSSSSLTVGDASGFPSSGQFVIEPMMAITAKLLGSGTAETVTYHSAGRLVSNLTRYTYTSVSGNTIGGITPALPAVTSLIELSPSSLVRSNNTVTCTVNNSLSSGDVVSVTGSSGIDISTVQATTIAGSATIVVADPSNLAVNQILRGTGIAPQTKILDIAGNNILVSQSATASGTASVTFSESISGAFVVQTASSTQLTFTDLGSDGTAAVPGTIYCEKLALAAQDCRVVVTTAVSSDDSKIVGPYVWDPNAPFVLSADSATISQAIVAGKPLKLVSVSDNSIAAEGGYAILNYGQNIQEGPVRVLYKPNPNTLILDPSYVFQFNHPANSTITMLSHRGPHVPSGSAAEYPPYLTDPVAARTILEGLIQSVTSAGIFVDFLIRYPTQLYGTLSVYKA